MERLKFINNAVAAQLLRMDEAMETLESAIREEGLGTAANRTKSAIHIPTDGEAWYRYCSMEGGSRGLGVVAVRIKSDVSTSPVMYGMRREQYYCSRPGKFCGLIYLFSAVNGEPLAIINDGFVQHVRVGATYGLGAKHVSRTDARTMGVIGSGGMARVYAEAVSLVRPLRRIKVFSPNREHREAYAREVSAALGIEVEPVATAGDAARGVDLLAAMTDTLDPVIDPRMLAEGMHLCVVKANTEITREAMERVDWAVIYRTGTSEHHYTTPESFRPSAPGGTTDETVGDETAALRGRIHQLSDVLLGRVPGRRRESDITYFTAEGTGTQFAACAKLVYERAVQQGLGEDVPLDWFLQDINN